MADLTRAAILLVDDLEENLIALEALLRREGLELLQARSGMEALEILLQRDVALALLDVQMPEMDGFELAELMRGTERTRHVPIIFLTAGAHDGQRVFRGYEVGAVDFLYKPLDPVLLNHKVNTFVDLYRQRIEREQLAAELREMLRLNETFVAAVGHDLRAALTTVVMGAEVLESEYSTPDALHTLARLRSSADRMSRMLDQLYDLARARVGGGIALDRRAFDFRALTERIVGELRLAHPGRTITTEYSGDSTVSAWDETRMAQVLSNLVGNALRHGTPGEPVRVRVRATPAALQVEVHNGGEIAADIRPHLFDPFRRHTQSRRDSLGLGLYIVR
ncbi:MAG: hybrid sensor histidine kinase/response regulator, partial [Myxococcales bacterium]